MLVVVAHAGLGNVVPGGSGVTIFFSISGFIITYLMMREYEETVGFSVVSFYARRTLKILPPLILVVGVPTIVYAWFRNIDWADFAAQMLFYYNWILTGQSGDVLPGTDVVWSLSIEEQFYILFAVVWLVLIKFRDPVVLTMFVAVALVGISASLRVIISLNSVGSADRIYYGSDTRFEGIAWGMMTAALFVASGRMKMASRLRSLASTDLALLTAFVMYVASLVFRDEFFRDTFRFTIQSIFACVVILYGFGKGRTCLRRVFCRVAGARPVQLVGLASYSIYLTHLVVLLVIRQFVSDYRLPWVVAASVLVATFAGVLFYLLVEKPFERLRSRLHSNRRIGERRELVSG
jgi:peptidoglycan/LPS O-acetylase OafA/YrhL